MKWPKVVAFCPIFSVLLQLRFYKISFWNCSQMRLLTTLMKTGCRHWHRAAPRDDTIDTMMTNAVAASIRELLKLGVFFQQLHGGKLINVFPRSCEFPRCQTFTVSVVYSALSITIYCWKIHLEQIYIILAQRSSQKEDIHITTAFLFIIFHTHHVYWPCLLCYYYT